MQGIRQKLSQFVTPHWTQQKSQRRAAAQIHLSAPLRLSKATWTEWKSFDERTLVANAAISRRKNYRRATKHEMIFRGVFCPQPNERFFETFDNIHVESQASA